MNNTNNEAPNKGMFSYEDSPNSLGEKPEQPMPFFKRLVSIFFAPLSLMKNIAMFPHYFSPIMYMILLAVPTALLSGAYTALTTKATANFMFEKYNIVMPDTAMLMSDSTVQIVSLVIQIVTVPLGIIALGAGGALTLFLLCKIFRGQAKYTQLFSMFLHVGVINMLGTILVYTLSGVTQNIWDYTSLAPLLLDRIDLTSPAYYVLSSMSLFSLWAAAVQCGGVKVFNMFGWVRAVIVTVIFFALGLMVSLSTGLVMELYMGFTGDALSGALLR
ncbi:MAG: hypothetical protein LBS62_07275 [Clostridiales bacterium]|jgi:hypothetical protein|nr:hypothetical protein [Clostridiales bacterium]